MENTLEAKLEFTGKDENPIKFGISFLDIASSHQNDVKKQSQTTELQSLYQILTYTEDRLQESLVSLQNLRTSNESLSKQNQSLTQQLQNYQTLILKIDSLTNQNTELSQSLNITLKSLEDKEKIIKDCQETVNTLKDTNEALKFKAQESQNALEAAQKTLTIKSNQVFKLSQALKERDLKKSTAEVILEEQERKNTEIIEKNVRLEKNSSEQDRKIQELNKRLISVTQDLKNNEELVMQRETQIKKLINRIKELENESRKREEDTRNREKTVQELQKSAKFGKSAENKGTRGKDQDEIKKLWDLISSKDEEIALMKDMIRSLQFTNQKKPKKLPPLAGSRSEKIIPDYKSLKPHPKPTIKIRESKKKPEIFPIHEESEKTPEKPKTPEKSHQHENFFNKDFEVISVSSKDSYEAPNDPFQDSNTDHNDSYSNPT